MVKFICDNQEIETLLSKMCDLLTDNGGVIHEDLCIRACDGNLTVEAQPSISRGDKLISIPHDTLLHKDKFDLAITGDDEIIITSSDPSTTSVQMSLMEIMLQLYNLTGKLAYFKQNSTTRLFWNDKDLYARIAPPKKIKNLEGLQEEAFYLQGFLGTRYLGAKAVEETEKHSSVLMPIIDFFNNSNRAAGYDMSKGNLSVMRSPPVTGSDECFVRYGLNDAHSLLIGYDYLDQLSDFVISQPMTVELDNLNTIQINRNTSTKWQQKVPQKLVDLKGTIPAIKIDRDSKKAMVSFIVVPSPNRPRAMRRILAMVVNALSPRLSQIDRAYHINSAEQQVIDGNRKYYSDLKEYLGTYESKPEIATIIDDVRAMVEGQLALLNAYSFDAARR